MKINKAQWQWTREPKEYKIEDECIEIVTEPHTDLWQRTYYHFRNDNAPVLQIRTSEKYFSFVVKTEFASKHRFDQCGVVMYLDSVIMGYYSFAYVFGSALIRICSGILTAVVVSTVAIPLVRLLRQQKLAQA